MRLAIIADTHMPRGSRRLPQPCIRELAGADRIVHLGDFSAIEILRELRALGPPVEAVIGNVDDARLCRELPESRCLELDGARIAAVHDAGPARGRLARLRRRFEGVDAVLFGHSHLPLHEMAADGFQIFNPGSPTERRRAPHRTMGVGEVAGGRVALRHVILD